MRPSAALAALAVLAGTGHAAVVAVAMGTDRSVELHDEQGVCLEPARHALYVHGETRVPGCWVMVEGTVRIVFLDGDALALPMRVFRKPTQL